MKLFNFHTHCHYCDGSSAPVDYVEEAIRQEFEALGFSSHSPLPFGNKFALQGDEKLLTYADEIRQLKITFQDQVSLYLGLELDFVPGITKPFEYFRSLVGLDYTIGGIHLIKKPDQDELWFIDGPLQQTYDEGMKLLFGDDVHAAITTYWQQMREMISSQKPNVVAHLDKIKMHNKNRYFNEDETWYVDQTDLTLELIKKTGTIVEVNTRGIYKGRSEELFPGITILKKIHQLGIPVTISADAHRPEELSAYFEQAFLILKSIGFDRLMFLNSEGWIERPF